MGAVVDPTTALTLAAAAKLVGADKLVERFFGPLLDESGQMLASGMFRERRRKAAALAQAALEARGIEPTHVPAKFALPIFIGVSVEDDEGLSKRWAALLANIAGGMPPGTVRPIFTHILSQLTSEDAVFLDVLYENRHAPTLLQKDFADSVVVGSLVALGLVEPLVTGAIVVDDSDLQVTIAALGVEFVRACQMPLTP